MFYNTADWRFHIQINDSGGAVDLTGKTLRMSWRNWQKSAPPFLEATPENGMLIIADPPSGRIEIVVPWSTVRLLPTGNHHWSLIEILGPDNRLFVAGGQFEVMQGIAQ